MAHTCVPSQFVSANFKEYGESAAKDRQQFFVSIYNMPEIITIRRLRTDKIGQLSSITGTVTRSSDVRPELLSGTFRCGKCGNCCENVEQQFIFTPPSMCNNPRCDNMTDFTLETDKSIFVDWQRLRVQENSEEVSTSTYRRRARLPFVHAAFPLCSHPCLRVCGSHSPNNNRSRPARCPAALRSSCAPRSLRARR